MEISFWLIYDILKEENPYIVSYHSYCEGVKTARMWHKETAKKKNVLYFVSNASREEIEFVVENYDNVVILSDVPLEKTDNEKMQGNVMIISSRRTAEELFSELLDKIEEYQEWYVTLLKAAVSRQPVSEVLKIAAQKLDNPIALFDASGNLAGWEGEFRSNWEGTIWEPVIEQGYAPASFYTAKEWRVVCEKMLNRDRITIMEISRQPNRPIICLGVIVNDEMVASIGTVEINTRFTQGQISLIEILRDMLVTAFGNSEDSRAVSKNSVLYLEKLILGESVDTTKLHYYLLHRGWNEQDRYRMMCCDIQNISKAALQYLSERMVSLQCKGAVCKVQDMLVLLMNEKEYKRSGTDWKKELEEVLSANKRYVIISDSFSDIRSLHLIYEQCMDAWKCLRKRETVENVSYLTEYRNYYQKIVRDTLLSDGVPDRWCDPLLNELLIHPLESQSEWIRTLYIYLLNGRNIAKTAKTLFIHRNSLVYRLKKIEEYLDIDLENMDDQTMFRILFSCMLLLKS